jgi:alpha-tubulin suppressor-like RCC1 family protein
MGVCIGGSCDIECQPGFSNCDDTQPGCELPTHSDKNNCGDCGIKCVIGCQGSSCDDPVDITAGSSHSCALTKSGRVYCWGRNQRGEIGDGTMTHQASPTLVPLAGPAAQISAGGNYDLGFNNAEAHTCAALQDGTVQCWGGNIHGQSGDGGNSNYLTSPSTVVNLINATQISAGGQHTCAVRSDNVLLCWGLNNSGQIGIGGTADANVPTSVMTDVKQVSTGTSHTCAIKTDGSLYCWGRNDAGRLGIGTLDNFVTMPALVSLVGVDQIAAGGRHTCARKGTQLYCWGADYNCAVGVEDFSAVLTPQLVMKAPETSFVALGQEHTAAISGADQSLFMWGVGQGLGIPMPALTCMPTDYQATGGSRLALGKDHSCLLNTTGEVLCWGSNVYGQLGDGTKTDAELPPKPVIWP